MSNVYKRNLKRRRRRAKHVLSRRQATAVKAIVDSKLEEEVELKWDDVKHSLTCSTTPTFFDITAQITSGVDPYDYIGNTIRLQSLAYKIYFSLADTTNYIRLVFFQWYDDAVNTPTFADICQLNTAGSPIDQTDYMSPLALGAGTTKSFRILRQFDFVMSATEPACIYQGFINKGFRKDITFATNDPTQGNNHIFMMYLSDSSAVAHPAGEGWTRIRFTDA